MAVTWYVGRLLNTRPDQDRGLLYHPGPLSQSEHNEVNPYHFSHSNTFAAQCQTSIVGLRALMLDRLNSSPDHSQCNFSTFRNRIIVSLALGVYEEHILILVFPPSLHKASVIYEAAEIMTSISFEPQICRTLLAEQ